MSRVGKEGGADPVGNMLIRRVGLFVIARHRLLLFSIHFSPPHHHYPFYLIPRRFLSSVSISNTFPVTLSTPPSATHSFPPSPHTPGAPGLLSACVCAHVSVRVRACACVSERGVGRGDEGIETGQACTVENIVCARHKAACNLCCEGSSRNVLGWRRRRRRRVRQVGFLSQA